MFPSRSKRPPLEIIKCFVTTLRNQDKKVAFILVDEDGALTRSSEFINTCHNMNIIVQTTSGDASSLNGKIEIPDNTLANITRATRLKSSHKKELWLFAYQYAILISFQMESSLRGDIPYFLWNVSRPLHKQIKIWGVRLYIIMVGLQEIIFIIDHIMVI